MAVRRSESAARDRYQGGVTSPRSEGSLRRPYQGIVMYPRPGAVWGVCASDRVQKSPVVARGLSGA